jgi:hypothetical protein
MIDWFHYAVFKAFANRIYKESLGSEHLMYNGSEMYFETYFRIIDGCVVECAIDDADKRSCYLLEKGSEQYMLPLVFAKHFPLKVLRSEPCHIKKSDKRVWKRVLETEAMVLPSKKRRSFKEFVTAWNPVEHTNPQSKTFLTILAIASRYKGVKLCICSEPAAMKNANFTLIGHITGDVVRMVKPTLARIENAVAYNRVLIFDEVTSMTKESIDDIELPIAWFGDNSSEYDAHSMKTNKKQQKSDLTQTSIIFPYNRKQDIGRGKVFFDEKWTNPGAIKDRYPQFLIEGRVAETAANLNMTQAEEIMKTHFNDIAKVASELNYWFLNMHKEMHKYNRDIYIMALASKNRHITNTEGLLDALDVYCDTQQEFDDWQTWLLSRMQAYKRMVSADETTYDAGSSRLKRVLSVEEELA